MTRSVCSKLLDYDQHFLKIKMYRVSQKKTRGKHSLLYVVNNMKLEFYSCAYDHFSLWVTVKNFGSHWTNVPIQFFKLPIKMLKSTQTAKIMAASLIQKCRECINMWTSLNYMGGPCEARQSKAPKWMQMLMKLKANYRHVWNICYRFYYKSGYKT